MIDLERLKRMHKDILKFLYEHRIFTTKEFTEFCKRRWGASKSTAQRWLKEDCEEGIIEKVDFGVYRVSENVREQIKVLLKEAVD